MIDLLVISAIIYTYMIVSLSVVWWFDIEINVENER